jgi:hypothetical protein
VVTLYNTTFAIQKLYSAHTLYLCLLYGSQQRAIISIYNTNFLVFVTETERVYCAVRAEPLNIIEVCLRLKRLVAGLTPRRNGFDYWSVHVRFVLDKVALEQTFLPVLLFYLVCIIPPTLHTHLHLHVALTRRTNGRSLGTSRKEMLFRKSISVGQKRLPLSIPPPPLLCKVLTIV